MNMDVWLQIFPWMVIAVWTLGTVYDVLWGKKKSASDVNTLGRDVHRLIFEYETQKRKASEYLSKIEEVIKEREQWRVLYNDQASGHDNAQALMLETITRIVHLYRKETGKNPVLDPIIEMARGEWSGTHGPEAREKLGENGIPKEDPA